MKGWNKIAVVFVVLLAAFLCKNLLAGPVGQPSPVDNINSPDSPGIRNGAITSGDMMDTRAINLPDHDTRLGRQKSENSDGVETLADTWKTEIADESKNIGLPPHSIAIDARNNPHIIYVGRHLYYARYDGSQWHYEEVEDSIIEEASLALDASGKAHISYYDRRVDSNLKYATNASGAWVTTTVCDDVSGGGGSIVLDASGKAHMYYTTYVNQYNYHLKYVTNTSGKWVTTTVDRSYDRQNFGNTLVLDTSGKVHISYISTDSTKGYPVPHSKYATNASGEWVTTEFEGRAGYASMVIDASGKAHLTRDGKDSAGEGDLLYITNASGAWVRTVVTNYGWGSSLALDASGKVHISYAGCGSMISDGKLMYATNASGLWVRTLVYDYSGSGGSTSMVLDASGNAHIGYCYSGFDAIEYATNASGAWVTTTVDMMTRLGYGNSLALDASGKAHISHCDLVRNDIKYTTNASGAWVTDTIGSGAVRLDYGFTPANTSLALDASGKVHISYNDYDFNNNQACALKYATNASGAWVTTMVDNSDVNISSLALDASGKAHISYNTRSRLLKYATNASGAWVKTMLDAVNVEISSLALDASGKAHISYSGDDSAIVYVTNASGAWVKTIVDADAGWKADSAIALDASGKAHISYHNSYGDLMYATNASGAWVTTTVNNSAVTRSSIALDASGKVHISYTFESQPYKIPLLGYATNASGKWVTTTVYEKEVGASISLALDAAGKAHISYMDYRDNDLMYATNAKAGLPVVTTFQINSGAAETTSRTVTLNNTAIGSPTHYMASESASFTGAGWLTYAAAPSFTLSAGGGAKTVYFKVKNADNESSVVSDDITLGGLPVVTTFQINNGAAETTSRTVTLNNTATGSPTHYMASESAGFTGASWLTYAAAPSFTLSAGGGTKTVYFKVKNAGGESAVVNDAITLKESLVVATFQINSGAAETKSRKVTLNSTATGSPTQYMASESATFTGAAWKAYKGNKAIKFTLSMSLGVKTVYFKVKNASGESAVVSDTITLKKALTATVADAGIDQLARRGSVITLDGSRSFSADENVPLTYHWSFVSMPSGTGNLLSDLKSVNPTFVLKRQGKYEIQLVVEDSRGTASEPDTIIVSTQDTTPVAHAGSDQSIHEVGTRVKLNGSQSYDPDGDALAYQWTFISRPAESAASLEDADTARPVFVADAPGDYNVQLTVTDEQMHRASDTVSVSFENVMPVANAGKSLAVKVGDTVTLAGDGADANGDALSYQWIMSSRPGESLSEMADSSARVTSFIPDRAGAYVAQLVVNDGDLTSEPSAIQIQAFTTQTKAIKALQGLEAEIAELDSGVFRSADMQNALLNKLNAVIANVEAGKQADAANQLRNDILPKMGGAENAEGGNAVWITGRSLLLVEMQDVVGALEMAR